VSGTVIAERCPTDPSKRSVESFDRGHGRPRFVSGRKPDGRRATGLAFQ
jgi:hypothetical protein